LPFSESKEYTAKSQALPGIGKKDTMAELIEYYKNLYCQGNP